MKSHNLFQKSDSIAASNALNDHILSYCPQAVKNKLVDAGPGRVILWYDAEKKYKNQTSKEEQLT